MRIKKTIFITILALLTASCATQHGVNNRNVDDDDVSNHQPIAEDDYQTGMRYLIGKGVMD